MIYATESAKHLIKNAAPVEKRTFPDGERYLRVLPFRGKDATLVANIRCGGDLFETLQYLDAFRRLNKNVVLLMPYLGYARQDRAYKKGECVSAAVIAKSLMSYRPRFLFVNPHSQNVMRLYLNKKIVNILPALVKKLNLKNPLIVAADEGARHISREVADAERADYTVLKKRRISDKKVEMKFSEQINIKDDVIIVDDMISTGTTILKAAALLKREGARNIYAAAAHGVFSDKAISKINSSLIKKVVISNSLFNKSKGNIKIACLNDIIRCVKQS